MLSVSPGSVREDARGTIEITVSVRDGDGVSVDTDTYVQVNLVEDTGFNTRFQILSAMPTIKIPADA